MRVYSGFSEKLNVRSFFAFVLAKRRRADNKLPMDAYLRDAITVMSLKSRVEDDKAESFGNRNSDSRRLLPLLCQRVSIRSPASVYSAAFIAPRKYGHRSVLSGLGKPFNQRKSYNTSTNEKVDGRTDTTTKLSNSISADVYLHFSSQAHLLLHFPIQK